MKKILFALAIFSLLFAGAALAADSIRVGVVLPLTGKLANFGEIEKNSFNMALDEINTAGGVNGRPIELVIEDSTGKPDVARSAVEKLISRDKVLMIGGGYSSSATWAAVAVAQQRRTPFLVNTGSADKITEQGWNYIFRLNPPASEYPQSLDSFLKANCPDVKNVVILHENSLFGQSSSRKFEAQCKQNGLNVLMKEGYEAGAVDFKPLLVSVKAKKPDLIYMVSYVMDASLLMRQAKELNLNAKLFVGGGAGFTMPEFLKNAGEAANLVYSATLWTKTVPYPGAKEFFDKYRKRYGQMTDYHGAEAYAAMFVIADALKRAKSLTREGVRDSLAATDMMTSFGRVKFVSYGKKTQQNKLPTFLVQWQNGVLETVWPKEMATKPFIYPTAPWNKR